RASLEAPFLGLPIGGPFLSQQFLFCPLLTNFPITLYHLPKLLPGGNLLASDVSLLGRQKPRLRLAADGPSETVIRSMPRLRFRGTSTTLFAALYEALRDRASAHRFSI